MINIDHIDCAIMPYNEALELQRQYFDKVLGGEINSMLIFVEHPNVYTLGKSGHQNNLLISDDFLAKIGATYVLTDRGGDITYHGPGQLVVYPILNLNILGISLREYIYKLEQTIIATTAQWNIAGERIEGATGVWIEQNRKIAAIGVKASRGVTMHGAAINVTTDLKYFSYINPCGFVDKGVTSIEFEKGAGSVEMDSVKNAFRLNFEKQFGVTLQK